MLNVESPQRDNIHKRVDTSDEFIFPCWNADIPGADYINLVALNEAGEVLIIEDLTANSAWGSWHLVSGLINDGENPLTAVEQRLLELTGYRSNNWLYLGSFMVNAKHPDVAGHFFSARHVKQVAPPRFDHQKSSIVRWISRRELKHALLDGRIGLVNYAVAASLALLLLPIDPIITPEDNDQKQ